MTDESSVRVAVRIRPQIPREVIDMCRICTQVPSGEPQVYLGPEKAFTYDYVFDRESDQGSIYESCVNRLVEGTLDGYNATVLAYGQTGSGKTYTMGTGFDVEIDDDLVGIIPRAIKHLFNCISDKQEQARDQGMPQPEFKITAQFLELYNEELKDLLEPGSPRGGARIHEDAVGNIYLVGVESKVVTSSHDALEYLRLGALSRTTGSTQMNTQSSRSHAIFTLHIKQQRCVKTTPDETNGGEPELRNGIAETYTEFESLTAKFHFVDLAGSERLKRTGATGDRAKEGISINCGLLALGNVISALGDKTKRALHVPYRDSKLTRLLQDSLGGNSQTVMIACVSPSDRDFMETLSTLKYANRARNIKNKVTINQDTSSRTIASLRREIQQLQLELVEYRQGRRIVGEDGINDTWHENQMLNTELQSLRLRVKALSETIEALRTKNALLLAEKAAAQWISSANGESNGDITNLVQGYLEEIEELKARLLESEAMYQQLKKRQLQVNHDVSQVFNNDSTSLLMDAKKELQKEINLLAILKDNHHHQNNNSNNKEAEDADMKDVNESENRQESMSDDDSEYDSDRKEESEEGEAMSRELEALTSTIDVKQRLIQELELSQKRLQTLKQHYEDKLAQLQARIRDTQDERDKVLSSLQQQPIPPTEKLRKLRDEYEKKLTIMQKEVKMLQSAKKEHARLLKSQTQNESRLKSLRDELAEMKRAKVKLVNKMKEEAQKHKENELKRNREIAQLRKESRKNTNMIRSLEAERRKKEVILRRKQEEVTALRKRDRGLSHQVAGRNVLKSLNIKVLKHRWQSFERTITKQALAKQAAAETEKEMERLLQEREESGQELERLKKLKSIVKGDTSDIDEDIDNITSKISYLQESILECQRAMVEMGDGEADGDGEAGADSLISNFKTIEEAQYIMQRMLQFTIDQSCIAAQKQLDVRDMETRLKQVAQESEVQHQLLEHVLRDRDLLSINSNNLSNNVMQNSTLAYSPHSSRSSSPDNSESQSIFQSKSVKVRRKTTQPQELLYGTSPQKNSVGCANEESNQNQNHNYPLTRVSSAPGSLKEPIAKMDIMSLPGSPLTYRRFNSREENVFSRLTAGRQSLRVETKPSKGIISTYNGKSVPRAILQCTHVAEGHSKAVLSIDATQDTLFSGSKDRTVKVWDLGTGIENMTLIGHPNNVVAVKYSQVNKLLFSVSAAYVKVWDLRSSNACIKTLYSSGNSQSGGGLPTSMITPSRSNLAVGESTINDLVLSRNEWELYTASSDKIRIWDLRKLICTGKLHTPHTAAVMCLSFAEDGRIVAGSKDHLISLLEPNMCGQSHSLSPPHYDGVQCLATLGNTLISGSRDMCIKRWDLGRMELIQSINNAHKDWILGLCLINNGSVMISGCRNGYLRAWTVPAINDQVNESAHVGEVRAHTAAINSIVTNQQQIFTASNSGEVKLWRVPDASLAAMSTSTISL